MADYNFEVFTTHDGTVSKYIHEDGSETAIKRIKSVQSVLNPITREIEVRHSDRNKYSVFISSSVGCPMKCPFCHLTIKDAKYRPLTKEQVLANLKEALEHKISEAPELRSHYIKLSWMGMGDAIFDPAMVRYVTMELLAWVFEQGYAQGLDGVDLSTVLPAVKHSWIAEFQRLDVELEQFPRNPANHMDNVAFSTGAYTERRPFRLFFSLHSAIQEKRDAVVPNALPLVSALKALKSFQSHGRHSVVIHHLLVEGLNDSEEELTALIQLMNTHLQTNELRVLRYNHCVKGSHTESEKFLPQIRHLADNVPFLKVQVSPGTEVSAACGQFIVKDFIQGRKKAA